MRKINEIIIHCTATRPTWMANRHISEKVAEIRRWHTSERKWKDIGYHFIIDRDGTVAPGRPVEQVGAHVEGRNSNTVGIALIGGHGSNRNDPFDKHFTLEQNVALHKLVDELRMRFPQIKRVSGHNEFAARACPGFSVPNWYEEKPERTSLRQSTTMQAGALQVLSGTGVGVLSAIGGLSTAAQLAIIGLVAISLAASLWIMRERIKAWRAGWH